MIKIIFFPGTHGNYVEFVLNKLIHGDKIGIKSPLGSTGTSHKQRTDANYQLHRDFQCVFITRATLLDPVEKFIKIDFPSEEDITVVQLNLKRAEDYNIDPDTIHQDTYHKLLNKTGLSASLTNGPNKIIERINQYTDISPYYNIKDPAWPDITSVEEFWRLPDHIVKECVEVFGFHPVHLSEHHPDAPKWVLRNIFKSWFENNNDLPSASMKACDDFDNVYKLNLRNLYTVDSFYNELQNISQHFDLDLDLDRFDKSIHQQFIDMVPFRQAKEKCWNIIQAVESGENIPINLNVVEQGYVNCVLEKRHACQMPFEKENYFEDTQSLQHYIMQIRNHGNNQSTECTTSS